MKNIKAFVAACVIFLSGAVLGVAGTRYYVQRAVLRTVAGDTAHVERLLMARLDDRLELTEAQRQALRPVLVRALADFATLRRETRPRGDAILARAVGDMKAELTPGQGEALAAMAARFRAARDGASSE
jgi:hypothetical protein